MIHVNLGRRSYDIAVNNGGGVGAFAASRVRVGKAIVVCDENVSRIGERMAGDLQSSGFQVELMTIRAGEQSKSLAVVNILYDQFVLMNADRQTTVVAVGGGMTGDLTGFVAATYNRGLPWIIVPTTLLAMVDSSVGGKVGVNLPQGKNLVGAFHQPAGVWIDTSVLASLPIEEFRSGLAEVVKYGVILDADFFMWLEQNVDTVMHQDAAVLAQVVSRCCQLKASVVEQDEREEAGHRMILNYGHTFAHAFETASNYTIRHGEAVAIGMICASHLAASRGLISSDVVQQQVGLLRRFGLPVVPPRTIRVDDCLINMQRDKKAIAGIMRFVVPKRIGSVTIVDDVTEREVRQAIATAAAGQ